MAAQKAINWRIFFILWAAAILGVIAIIPYSLALQAPALENVPLPMPLSILIPIQVLQNAVLFGLVLLAGLFLARRIGLGTPILEAWLAGEKTAARLKAILLPSILLGVIAALAIIALDLFVFQPAMQAQLGAAAEALNLVGARPTAWQGFLASFYGGINEEILLRLLVLSLFAWLGKFVSHTSDGRPTTAILWIANILAAALFGLGHLPSTSMLVPLTPMVILRAVILNGLAGIAFGYLYWKHGLEAAILSHFSTDIVLHVLLAL